MPETCNPNTPCRILYVDDDPSLLEVGKYFLESEWGFSVDTLTSARTALGHLESRYYDAIISDFQMPGMDGIAFLKALRSTGNTTPFIIFTGKGREEIVIQALNSGADFYLQKGGEPVSQFAELAHKIRHAIFRKRSDLALMKSERNYRYLIEHASEAIFVVQDELLRMINPKAIELSGYSEEELLNQPFTRFVHPDDGDRLLDRFRKRITDARLPTHYTFRILRRDGAIRWVELNVVAITWNEHPAILNFMTDITDRKLSGDALRESEERYRHFFRTTLDGLFITTPDAQWIDFNDAVVEMFGCKSRDEIYGRPIVSFYVDPKERERLVELVEQDGYVKEHPVLLRKLDGTTFNSLMTVVSQKNPDGSTRVFIGTIRDITKRKRADDALRESEENFRSIVESALEGILITDLSGNIVFANRAAARILECGDSAGLTGRNVMEFVAPVSQKDVMKDFEEVTRGHDGYLAHYQVISAKGNAIAVESVGKVITYEGEQRDLISFRTIPEPVSSGIGSGKPGAVKEAR